MRRLFISIGLLVLVVAGGPAAFGQLGFGKGATVTYDAALENDTVQAGIPFLGAVQVSISDGWHMNGHTPLDDFLIPTELTLEDTEGFDQIEIVYPEHEVVRLGFSEDPVAVYDGSFVIGFRAQADADLAAGDYVLNGSLRYQACNDTICAQPQVLAIAIPITVTAAETTPERTAPEWFAAAAWDQLPPVDQLLLAAASEAEEAVVERTEEAVVEGAEELPADESETAAEQRELVTAEARPATVEALVEAAPSAEPSTEVEVGWRALADQFKVTGSLAGYTQTRGFLTFLEQQSESSSTDKSGASSGWWWMILVVVGGGLLLNFTPCVLPLIPINIAIIGAGAQAGSRKRGFALGTAYGLGMALVYGSLGLVVVLGLSTAFGVLNATVWFNVAIALLFVVLALAMFDVIQIDFSKFQGRLGVKSGGHFFAALGMGAVSALLAGACVAPVVIYTVLQAQDLYSNGYVFALALPFGLGVGMALPWPFLGAGLSFLPKPGMWMVRVKQAFGVFILIFAVYYGYLAYTRAVYVPAETSEDSVWTASLEEGLSRALEEQRPVIIDFWATWCKNCLAMDKTVLKDEAVLQQLEDHVKIKFQAEDLSGGSVQEVVEYFGVLGLPTFVVLEPKG
ncbi:MAG: cytochrome c biogenesis protein CcdA [Candidatus Hydrogenedentales bacterium]|jgi:thiol:disulfide interchange protein DsbD